MLPEAVKNFVERFSRLPAVGRRLATRLAFYLAELDERSLEEIEEAIKGIRSLNRCPQCFALKKNDTNFCDICSDPARDHQTIAVVERESDAMAIEETRKYRGTYFIWGNLTKRGIMEPAQKMKLEQLKKRIKNGGNAAKEVILAFSLTTWGDFAAKFLEQELKNHAANITRIGQGIPAGGEIEFADPETLVSALDHRE